MSAAPESPAPSLPASQGARRTTAAPRSAAGRISGPGQQCPWRARSIAPWLPAGSVSLHRLRPLNAPEWRDSSLLPAPFRGALVLTGRTVDSPPSGRLPVATLIITWGSFRKAVAPVVTLAICLLASIGKFGGRSAGPAISAAKNCTVGIAPEPAETGSKPWIDLPRRTLTPRSSSLALPVCA